jgi:ribosomal protein S18 acetylase RimI-like enzyme
MRQANSTTLTIRAAQTTDISDTLRDLLLLADPDPQAVASYLSSGDCYVAFIDGRLSGVAVLAESAPDTLEIKNIAVAPESQGRGTGKHILGFLIQEARSREYTNMEVTTGNSSLGPLALYQKAGFRIVGITPNYFTEHYTERIEEHGIHCRDRIHLRLDLRERNGA